MSIGIFSVLEISFILENKLSPSPTCNYPNPSYWVWLVKCLYCSMFLTHAALLILNSIQNKQSPKVIRTTSIAIIISGLAGLAFLFDVLNLAGICEDPFG